MNDEKLHRLHVNIDHDTYVELKNTIQWGLRNTLIIAVLKIIIRAVQSDGMMIVGAILSGKYKLVIDRDKEDNDSA